MALPHNFYNNPQAYMGYVGFVRFRPSSALGAVPQDGYIIRAKSADINVKQEITKPDIIDSRYDRTVYQLGPKEIDGSIEFPAVYDSGWGVGVSTDKAGICECLYKHTIKRNNGILYDFPIDVKYAPSHSAPNESEFTYYGCIVNNWTFSVANQDVVSIKIDIIGLTREFGTLSTPSASSLTNNKVGNTRAVTWNDARVELLAGSRGGFNTLSGQYIRSFEATINNNAQRFYTLNGQLYAQALAPTKRDITGKVVLMGRHKDLAALAWDNEKFASEDTKIRFGYLGRSNSGAATIARGFGCQLPNVICQIEEMSLTNDLFETTVNWHSLPASCDLYDYLYNFDGETIGYTF